MIYYTAVYTLLLLVAAASPLSLTHAIRQSLQTAVGILFRFLGMLMDIN